MELGIFWNINRAVSGTLGERRDACRNEACPFVAFSSKGTFALSATIRARTCVGGVDKETCGGLAINVIGEVPIHLRVSWNRVKCGGGSLSGGVGDAALFGSATFLNITFKLRLATLPIRTTISYSI